MSVTTRDSQPDRLMRYRFDSAAQARRHVHVERRQLLFFPDLFLDVRDGQPVLLELCFLHSEQTMVTRGEVHGVETGTMRGAWLELYGMRLFEGILSACDGARRIQRRLPTDLLIRAEQPGFYGSVARLADVSASGARIVSAGGKWLEGGEILITELTGGPSLRGKVLRVRENDLSVQFQRDDATTRRGAIKLVELAMRRWSDARETRHPGACGCMSGGPLYEPLLPRAAHRRVEGS